MKSQSKIKVKQCARNRTTLETSDFAAWCFINYEDQSVPPMAGQPNIINEANTWMPKVIGRAAGWQGSHACIQEHDVWKDVPSNLTGLWCLLVEAPQLIQLINPATSLWDVSLSMHHIYWRASWAWQTPKFPFLLKCWASCSCKPRVCKRTWPVCKERKSSMTCFTLAILRDTHDHSDIQISLPRLRNFNLEKWRTVRLTPLKAANSGTLTTAIWCKPSSSHITVTL